MLGRVRLHTARLFFVAVLLLFALAACGVANMRRYESNTDTATSPVFETGEISPLGLQADIIAFADNFLELIPKSSDWPAHDADKVFVPAYFRVKTVIAAHPRSPKRLILDFAATDTPLHGDQEGRFCHGYYDHFCYAALCLLWSASVGELPAFQQDRSSETQLGQSV